MTTHQVAPGIAARAFLDAIRSELGHAPDAVDVGVLHRFPTSGKRSDDAGWCKLFDDLRGGVFGCHRQGVSQTWRATSGGNRQPGYRQQRPQERTTSVETTIEQQRKWERNAERNARLWSECTPLTGFDPASQYLENRGLGLQAPPATLRVHGALPYWEGTKRIGEFPAMVAPLVRPDGAFVALHRTYLDGAGRKASVAAAKKLTAASGSLSGASVPLFESAVGVIGVAEGIETALAAHCASGVPTVAAYCAASLATWKWPRDVTRVVVFGDADRAGRAAAESLRRRVRSAGLRCEIVIPSIEGSDWCDVWAARERAPGLRSGQ